MTTKPEVVHHDASWGFGHRARCGKQGKQYTMTSSPKKVTCKACRRCLKKM